MKIITNITGTASDSTPTLTPPRLQQKQPGDLYRQLYAEGILFTDGKGNKTLFPWTELEKAAMAAYGPPKTT